MTIPHPVIRIKVCCIRDAAELAAAVRHGASAVGLVSEMPSGPGPIPEERIAELASAVPPGVSSFLLTSATDVARIAEQQRRCGVDTIQLCDRLSPRSRSALRRELPGVRLVQVVHVEGEAAVDEAREAREASDALLLDSGRPDAERRELGGTGRTHDWEISRRIREAADVPVFLAGGLHPDNVSEAVRRVRPYGVDVCSGLRSDGMLDDSRVRAFVAAAGSA